MDKVPSVFATSTKSESSPVVTPTEDDEEEPMEMDELDTAICDNLVVRVVKTTSVLYDDEDM